MLNCSFPFKVQICMKENFPKMNLKQYHIKKWKPKHIRNSMTLLHCILGFKLMIISDKDTYFTIQWRFCRNYKTDTSKFLSSKLIDKRHFIKPIRDFWIPPRSIKLTQKTFNRSISQFFSTDRCSNSLHWFNCTFSSRHFASWNRMPVKLQVPVKSSNACRSSAAVLISECRIVENIDDRRHDIWPVLCNTI